MAEFKQFPHLFLQNVDSNSSNLDQIEFKVFYKNAEFKLFETPHY